MSTKTLSNGWQMDDAWSPIAEMSTKRYQFAAVALNDHQCLVMGGGFKGSDAYQCLSSVELYDKTTNKWTKMPDMKKKRYGPAVALVGNVVYVIGGCDGERCLDSVEVLDLSKPPRQRRWRVLKPPMTSNRAGCAAAVVGQKIYVMGGIDGPSTWNSVEIFDTGMQEWSIGPSMTTERYGCAAVAIGTTIYAIGGEELSVECVNVLATGNDWKWTLLPQDMPVKRMSPAATVIGDCIVALVGCFLTPAELWDHKCQKWMSLPSMNIDRYAGVLVTLGTTVLVIGGHDDAGCSSGEQLRFPKISSVSIPVHASSNAATASTLTGDAMADEE